ncbi:MAG: MBL fold metallo-hydrolase [Ruminococcaceae bacterium]|nr:MBL fold metallo-hydrolase [Oscillospiraceae bacterium]
MDIQIIATGSTGNAYRVSDGETAVLLDAGIPFRDLQRALGYRLNEIKGALITHSHKDHSKACADLLFRGVDVYTSAGTAGACGLGGVHLHTVKSLSPFDVGTFRVIPFDVAHDAPEPLGFLLTSDVTDERLLYFTDTFYLKYRFPGVTHLLGECNHDDEGIEEAVRQGYVPAQLAPRLVRSHMSLDTFLNFLRQMDRSRLKQIYLLHMSANNSNEKRFVEEVQKLTGVEVYAP